MEDTQFYAYQKTKKNDLTWFGEKDKAFPFCSHQEVSLITSHRMILLPCPNDPVWLDMAPHLNELIQNN